VTEVAPATNTHPCVLDADALQRTVKRLTHEIAERHSEMERVLLAGIPTRGVPLALRIARALGDLGAVPPPVAELNPRDYRDDKPRPHVVSGRAIRAAGDASPPRVEGATVIVVDDVIFTGRTLRAALDALLDAGRPAAVEVLVLIDRGHRELPVRATYVGKNVPTALDERVQVRLREVDGVDGAWLLRGARV
jgi:pyrimidine operon attenuation protein/uracil phosphoribosyltransferase